MSIRSNKIASLVKEKLSLIFLHKISDPKLGLITITNVKVTPDLKIAKVYLSVFDKSKREYVLEHLGSIKGYLRSELTHSIKTRNTPELNFFIDDTSDYVEKMENIFKKIHEDDNKRND